MRVTEQDVINEEMYEEEDDDLPTQYQRLNAHLHTTSVMFNKKLHDYIATQHGVRNMFMSQYQNQSPTFPQYGAQFPVSGATFPQASNWLSPTMLPPQQFTPSSPQAFQQPQSFSPTTAQAQGYRQSPYHVPQRTQSHQRALSIQLPQAPTQFDQPSAAAATTPQPEFNRRLSLPPQAFQHASQAADQTATPSLTQSPTAHPLQQSQSSSPQTASPAAGSVKEALRVPSGANSPSSYTFSPPIYPFSSQAFSNTPLTLSMPPESQQFLGSVLDPNDARTATLMAGSENLPQPFAPTYTYNPNKLARASNGNSISETMSGSAQTLSSGLNLKTDAVSDTSSTSLSDSFFSTDPFLSPGNAEFSAFFDLQGGDYPHSFDDQDNVSSLINCDQ